MKNGTPPKKVPNAGTLTVYNHIKNDGKPSELWKDNILTKDQVKKALRALKANDYIKNIGYGTWQITGRESPKEGAVFTHHVARHHTPQEGADVRMHGVVATLKIKPLLGWDARERMMERAGIDFDNIPQGQRLSLGSVKKIWLTNKSIVFYLPKQWYADTARGAAWECMQYLIHLIRRLEAHLGVSSFKINDRYWIRFSRAHYSLIRNELAKQYNEEKSKLFVYDEKGLWMLIDNSLNLNELETVHSNTGMGDNKTIQDTFNDFKRGLTPAFLAEQISRVSSNQQHFGRNLVTHTTAVNRIGEGSERLSRAIQDFEMRLGTILKGFKDMITERRTEAKKDALVSIEVLKDTGQFYGMLLGKSHLYDLKAGAKIYLDGTTSKALIKNGYAREMSI